MGPFSLRYGASSGCGLRGRSPDMEGSWTYIEKAVADSRKGVILKQKQKRGADNYSPYKQTSYEIVLPRTSCYCLIYDAVRSSDNATSNDMAFKSELKTIL